MNRIIKQLGVFFILFPHLAAAVTYSRDDIQDLAERHALSVYPSQSEENLKAQAAQIDTRIKIQPCQDELSAAIPNLNPYSSNMTVKISCNDNNGWTLYVPVQVKIMTPVVIANGYIEAGKTITMNDVSLSEVAKNRTRNGYISDINSLIGSKSKRQIRAGEILQSRNICFVCAGELVTIEASNAGLSVKAVGIALNDAAIGETVQVRNRASSRIVHGRVESVSAVRISL
ncbi:flagellar basal body P-ring formation chaperone FlgA [Gayadomonas joobiniege]|uniref:flagellar basal body P-ring formation chaperone FlgA n=1 Tax=Gayadomonas joobiniege TaxID=1234606 RepID=UPI0003809F2A|nr:flagellar basal body P-ring formation chaperone FlgA [Gayadomonas joobiniege]